MRNEQMKSLLQGLNLASLNDDETVRAKITVNIELMELIPMPTELELSRLEQNILSEGVRDPLIIWQHNDQYILVDGHNRFKICTKHNIKFPFKIISFETLDLAKTWMIRQQLGRRNLSPSNYSYLRGCRYNQEKQTLKNKSGEEISDGQNVHQNTDFETTADRLGQEYSVSGKTILRDGDFAKGVDKIGAVSPTSKTEILNGTSSLNKKEIQDVGKNKIEINQLLKAKSSKNKTQNFRIKQPTVHSIASMAFNYLNIETRSVETIASKLDIPFPINPVDYFIKWDKEKDINNQTNKY